MPSTSRYIIITLIATSMLALLQACDSKDGWDPVATEDDGAGNAQGSLALPLDIIAPVVPASTPVEMAGVAYVRARVAAGTQLRLKIDDDAASPWQASDRFELDIDKLTSGHHTVSVQAIPKGAASDSKPATQKSFQIIAVHGSGKAPKQFPQGLLLGHKAGDDPASAILDGHPWIGGMAGVVLWSTLQEDAKNAATFERIDTFLSAAGSSPVKHPYVLILSTGGDMTPSWVTAEPYERPFVENPNPDSESKTALVPWDPVLFDMRAGLTSQIAAAYDDDERLSGIYMTLTSAQYPEMIFPHADAYADDKSAPPMGIHTSWETPPKLGDDYATMLGQAWIAGINAYLKQFKRTPIVLMIEQTLYESKLDARDMVLNWLSSSSSDVQARVTVGAADLAPGSDTQNDKEFSALRSDALGNSPLAKRVYFEFGPRKSSTQDEITKQIEHCSPQELGCRAGLLFLKSWMNTTPQKVKTASCVAFAKGC